VASSRRFELAPWFPAAHRGARARIWLEFGEMRDGRRSRGRTCIRVWACTRASAGAVTPFVRKRQRNPGVCGPLWWLLRPASDGGPGTPAIVDAIQFLTLVRLGTTPAPARPSRSLPAWARMRSRVAPLVTAERGDPPPFSRSRCLRPYARPSAGSRQSTPHDWDLVRVEGRPSARGAQVGRPRRRRPV
jgi:hypothetical protein